jgi:hypothetical protein
VAQKVFYRLIARLVVHRGRAITDNGLLAAIPSLPGEEYGNGVAFVLKEVQYV